MKTRGFKTDQPSNSSQVKSFKSQDYDKLIKSGKFADDLFTPSQKSLYTRNQEIASESLPEIPSFLQQTNKSKFLSQLALRAKSGKYSWKRLSELFNIKELNIMKEPIDKDIIQGDLGDCYFLSALQALSEKPERIKKLVQKNKINDSNIYQANAFINGKPVSIVMDDFFPIIESENKLAFAGINPESKNIWPLIIEKAYAKANGSYEDIVSGNCSDAFRFLTPAPVETIYHDFEDKTIFEKIQNYLAKGFLVMCDITNTDNTNLDALAKMGLVTNHAYSVVDAVVLKQNFGEIKLLKIKNIWGTNEWLGDWSDGSYKWTDEFKKKVGLVEKEDGVFWMSLDDYVQFYTTTHVCHYHDDYEYISQKFPVQNDLAFQIAKVFVLKESKGYFMVNLKTTKIYKNKKNLEQFQNPFVQINVFRQDKDEFEYVGSDSGRQDQFFIECENMQPGSYYIAITFPKKEEKFDMTSGFVSSKFNKLSVNVGVYSSFFNLKIELANDNERNAIYDFVYKIVQQLANDNKENRYNFTNEGENSSFRIIKFDNDNNNGFGYIFYENNSEAYLRERIKITNLVNCNIIPVLKKGKFNIEKKEDKGNEEIEYEDDSTRLAMDSLKDTSLDSTAEIIDADPDHPLSDKNPAIIQFNVAPHSTCVVFLQKSDTESDLDMISDICFDYLPNLLLSEQKFKSKKFRLRYNNKPVEIFECITEHNTGVFFLYKNRTSEFRVKVTAKFNKTDNLYLQILSQDLKTIKYLPLRLYVEGQFRDDDKSREVSITVEPREVGFFGLTCVDAFQKFSYSCNFDYHFSLAKAPENLQTVEDYEKFNEINNNNNSDGIKKDEILE